LLFPNASFLGIDLSQRQIDDGHRRIAALGLSNVEIRQGDLAATLTLKQLTTSAQSNGASESEAGVCRALFR